MRAEDTGPCDFFGCDRPATETVVSNWDTFVERGEITLVTIQGWVESRCRDCAVAHVLWPPKPKV